MSTYLIPLSKDAAEVMTDGSLPVPISGGFRASYGAQKSLLPSHVRENRVVKEGLFLGRCFGPFPHRMCRD